MEITDDIKEAKEILNNIIKAKKTFRMYPKNNPVYIKALNEVYAKFKDYFDYKDNYTLKISQNSISYDSEKIYYNPEKEDNLALFFFKDGLREITFKKGLTQDELEEFLRVISLDFERDLIDDVVTLLWEKDFENIQYVVDETFLIDIDEEDYEAVAEKKVKDRITDVSDLMRAYEDGFKEEVVKSVSIVPLTDKDLQLLVKELEKDSIDKTGKLIDILFEIIEQADDDSDIEDSFSFLKEVIRYSMSHGDLESVIKVIRKVKELEKIEWIDERIKKRIGSILLFLGSEEIIGILSDMLESGVEIEPDLFNEYVGVLDKNAIGPMIKYLGELKTIKARRAIIEALIILGKKDIYAISRALEDSRWYVVRNIIYVLRKIADKRAIEYLLKTVRHSDIRVRKEVIRTLGELGGNEVIQTLRDCLNDPEMQIRLSAVKALGMIGSEATKRIIINLISDKSFNNKDFSEKKEIFETLSKWKDEEVFNFLLKIINKRAFFNRARINENKACAAYCLGLIGNKDALPVLQKLSESSNKILSEYSNTAIKRLEHG